MKRRTLVSLKGKKMTIDYKLPDNGTTWVVVFLDTKKRLMKALLWAHNHRRHWLAKTIDNGFEIVVETIGDEDIHNEIYGWSKKKADEG